ncbi:RdlA protein [Streptomyces sp. NRRL B-1568]|nr:RdlA protein [Streptomyces sp. NRRL B-1568]
MLKKVFATAVLTASAVSVVSGPAMALDHDGRHVSNGNNSVTEHGSTVTGGEESPQMTAVQGSLDKLCIGLGKVGIQSLIAALNIGIQDIPILTSQQQQQCTDNSTIMDGDDPLSHLVEQIPVISGNGSANG